jgi:hypothetical protein
LGTILRNDLGPELYKVAKALSVVIGFESFGDYVSHCVRRDVNMFIQGGDEIDQYFGDAYRHLVRQPQRGEQKQAKLLLDHSLYRDVYLGLGSRSKSVSTSSLNLY